MNRVKPPGPDSTLDRVLRSASRLQEAVPDAVLVGGSAAALYAAHRESLDHDHVCPIWMNGSSRFSRQSSLPKAG